MRTMSRVMIIVPMSRVMRVPMSRVMIVLIWSYDWHNKIKI